MCRQYHMECDAVKHAISWMMSTFSYLNVLNIRIFTLNLSHVTIDRGHLCLSVLNYRAPEIAKQLENSENLYTKAFVSNVDRRVGVVFV